MRDDYILTLKVGEFVAVTGTVETQQGYQDSYAEIFGYGRPRKPHCANGMPLEILAVSPPFICVTDGKEKDMLDLRRYIVARLNREYVQAVREASAEGTLAEKKRKRQARRDKKLAKDDPRNCQKCNGNNTRRQVRRNGKADQPAIWVWVCGRCDWDGDQPIIAERK